MKPTKGRFWAHPMTTGCLRTLAMRPSSLLEVSELMGVVEVVLEMFSVRVGVRPIVATFLPSYYNARTKIHQISFTSVKQEFTKSFKILCIDPGLSLLLSSKQHIYLEDLNYILYKTTPENDMTWCQVQHYTIDLQKTLTVKQASSIHSQVQFEIWNPWCLPQGHLYWYYPLCVFRLQFKKKLLSWKYLKD